MMKLALTGSFKNGILNGNFYFHRLKRCYVSVFLFAAVLGTSTAADCEALDLVGNDTVIVGDLYECLKEKYVKGKFNKIERLFSHQLLNCCIKYKRFFDKNHKSS